MAMATPASPPRRPRSTLGLGVLFFLLFLLFAPLRTAIGAQTDFPIKKGDSLGEGWVVGELTRHPEYIRFSLTRQGERTEIEVTFHNGPPSTWATRHYRIQPAPSAQPPESLLKRVKERIAAWEDKQTEAPPLVKKTRLLQATHAPLSEPVESFHWALLLIPAFLLLFALLGFLLFRRRRARRRSEPKAPARQKPSKLRLAIYYAIMITATLVALQCISLLAEARSGLRCVGCTPTLPGPKEPGEFRVYLFGESTVAGFIPGIEPLWFEAQLRQGFKAVFPKKTIRIYNFGQNGIDSQYLRAQFLYVMENAKPTWRS